MIDRHPPSMTDPWQRIAALEAENRRLCESEGGFRALFEQAPVGICRVSPEGKPTHVNRALQRMLGYSEAELCGRHVTEWTPAEDVTQGLRWIDRVRKGRIDSFSMESRFRCKDGRTFWARTSLAGVRDARGKVTCFIAVMEDIQARKQGETALAEQEARYRAVIETAADGFWMLNREGRLLAVNDAYVSRSGYNREELLGMTVADLGTRESQEEIKRHIETVVYQGCHLFETRHRSRDGKVWPVEINVSYSPGGGGLLFAFVRDISERKSLERRIIEASTAEQERIGREIHDGLGQQLTALSMLARSIQHRLDASGLNKLAGDLQELGGHLQAALEETRAIARDLIPVEFDPEGLVDALVKLTDRVRLSSGIACCCRQAGPVRVENSTVAMQLYRIAQEALHNAIRHGRPQRIEVGLEGGSDGLLLSVQDDGIGIGPERDHGKCLGLRTMRYRANSIGARLSISPAAGRGTLVRCAVPVAESW
ncbi:PAS domain-containing sensor histidine kinase [Sedimenticola hydrogenitrophicus]|uniref:PAS domain-containing sensor histidine kinase n=1 Tax=Sedimenticola hydrogenitrophicus TaxID=2967975 RepID=UPI0021A383B8|nr:PAS domain S-box protein [Sedimenticola hydrogenitrophicus]